MKLLLVGDCHGELPDIPDDEFDAVLAVGDVCGGDDEARSAMFESIGTDEEWHEKLGKDRSKEIVLESLRSGRDVLQRLDSTGKPVFVVPGNWDWTGRIYDSWSFLDSNRFQELVDDFRNVTNLNRSRTEIDGIEFVGYGPCSGPEIPQYGDDAKGKDLEESRSNYRRTRDQVLDLFSLEDAVFLSHNVPFDTELDRIRNEESPKHGRHYGSLVVRDVVQQRSLKLNVAGHMHEGEGRTRVGDTTCINTGIHTSQVIDTSSLND